LPPRLPTCPELQLAKLKSPDVTIAAFAPDSKTSTSLLLCLKGCTVWLGPFSDPAHVLPMLLAAMTNYGWRPGPGDPSFAGWVIFGSYLAVAFLALRAARLEAARGLNPLIWRVLAAGCVLLALNKQLDLHNAITAFGRGLARSEGWYRQRRNVQLALLVCFGLTSLAALGWTFRRTGAEWRRHRLTGAGMIFLITFIGVRAASFHHLDALLRVEFGGIRLHAAIEFAGICLLFVSAWHAARAPATRGK